MKRTTTAFTLAGCLAMATSAFAAGLQITEVYIGIPGPDGSADYVEVSNLGLETLSLGGLFYDDASLDITAGGALPDIELASGESAVFLVNIELDDADIAGLEDDAIAVLQEEANNEAIADFEAIFGTIPNLFALPNGGLGGSGDTAAILDSTGAIVDSLQYDAEDVVSLAGTVPGDSPNGSGLIGFSATFENLTGFNNTPGNLVLSEDGVNGAFQSATFLTDSGTFGGTEEAEDDPDTPEDETATEVEVPVFLVGSPGFVPASAVVPEPTCLALSALAFAGLGLRRRR